MQQVEKYVALGSGIKDPHQCTLRTVCEIAETPRTADGIFGEIMNMFLAPNSFMWQAEQTLGNDYLEAHMAGFNHNNCSAYYKRCPLSIFTVSFNNLSDSVQLF